MAPPRHELPTFSRINEVFTDKSGFEACSYTLWLSRKSNRCKFFNLCQSLGSKEQHYSEYRFITLRQNSIKLISILMPVKNAGEFLKPCIDSIINQTFSDWELIAVNDGSTDGSDAVLKRYEMQDQRITTFDSVGIGIVDALRAAFSTSRGEVIHRMDADDLMPSSKLEKLLVNLENGSLSTGRVKYFRDDQVVGEGFRNYENWLNSVWKSGNGWKDVYIECPIASPAWLMYRQDFERIGGFSSELMPEDYGLAFRVLEYGLKVNFLDEVVHLWRDSSERTSRNEKKYFPTAYYPLKVKYFLKLSYDKTKPLLLWGAGKKGKQVAKLLLDREIDFQWVTNNENKLQVPIYNIRLKRSSEVDVSNSQSILVISGPKDKEDVAANFINKNLVLGKDYFWFC